MNIEDLGKSVQPVFDTICLQWAWGTPCAFFPLCRLDFYILIGWVGEFLEEILFLMKDRNASWGQVLPVSKQW